MPGSQGRVSIDSSDGNPDGNLQVVFSTRSQIVEYALNSGVTLRSVDHDSGAVSISNPPPLPELPN